MKQETKTLYYKEGRSGGAVSAVITLIMGIGISVLIMIFVGALGGQTYNLVEEDIDNISDATIKAHVKSGITSSFDALEQTGDYLPIIVLAVVIALVLALVVGFGGVAGGGMEGSAL